MTVSQLTLYNAARPRLGAVTVSPGWRSRNPVRASRDAFLSPIEPHRGGIFVDNEPPKTKAP